MYDILKNILTINKNEIISILFLHRLGPCSSYRLGFWKYLSETSLSLLGANFMVSVMDQTHEAIFQGTRKNAFPIRK